MAQQAKYSEEALMEQEFGKWLIKIRSQCRDYRAWLERTSDPGGYYREWIPQVEALQFAMWKTNVIIEPAYWYVEDFLYIMTYR